MVTDGEDEQGVGATWNGVGTIGKHPAKSKAPTTGFVWIPKKNLGAEAWHMSGLDMAYILALTAQSLL